VRETDVSNPSVDSLFKIILSEKYFIFIIFLTVSVNEACTSKHLLLVSFLSPLFSVFVLRVFLSCSSSQI